MPAGERSIMAASGLTICEIQFRQRKQSVECRQQLPGRGRCAGAVQGASHCAGPEYVRCDSNMPVQSCSASVGARRFTCILLVVLVAGAALLAEHWPQWRGADRLGIWTETGTRKVRREAVAVERLRRKLEMVPIF